MTRPAAVALVVAALCSGATARDENVDVKTASPKAVIEAGRVRAARLSTYRVRFTKEERLGAEPSSFIGPQVMDLVVREKPYAVRAEVVSGVNQGRHFLFDATQNPKQLRVREPGLLGLVALWIDVDSDLARDDTRHAVNELGYGFVFRMIDRDAELGRGRFTTVDEGLDAAGSRCLLITEPAGVAGLYADRTRLCFSADALLTRVDTWDARGPRERLSFALVDDEDREPAPFSLEAHGLQ